MKVALLSVPQPYLVRPYGLAPLGLMYMSSVLQANGVECSVTNLSGVPKAEVLEHIPEADLYGLSTTCVDYKTSEEMSELIKKATGKPVVLGGAHPSSAPELIDYTKFDAVCLGEGEGVIMDIVHDAAQGTLRDTYVGGRQKDLDAIPFPDRSDVGVTDDTIFADGERVVGTQAVNIIASRGCQYNCAFCAARGVWKGKIFCRSPQNVADEIAQVQATYGVSEFRFCDDFFNHDSEWVYKFCAAIGDLGVKWRASVRTQNPDVNLLQLMYAAGCYEMNPGIESGDQRVLDVLRKRTQVDENRKFVQAASEAGIHVRMLFMIGTPGESADTPDKNIAFIESVDYHQISLTQFRPYPGTAIWRQPEKFDCYILDREFWKYAIAFFERDESGEVVEASGDSKIVTGDLTKKQLETNIRKMRDYVLGTGRVNRG